MHIQPYPDFADVFADPGLEGFFFPLCTVSDFVEQEAAMLIHVVSSQGLWHDPQFSSGYSEAAFQAFYVQENKYQFKGDIRAFKGYELVRDVFKLVDQDFKENGPHYLASKMSTRQYQQKIRQQYVLSENSFDLDYYLESFYTYSIVRLHTKLTGRFENFNKLIDGWKSDKQAFFYPATDKNCKNSIEELVLNESYLFNTPINLANLIPVGACWGEQYFDDGPNIFVFYDKAQACVYCVNQYS